ncbi:GntR family transcriptional regulator [soil metagenome]
MADTRESTFRVIPIDEGQSLLDRVAGVLRTAILDGELPAGTRLSVPELARQLNVSRTPTREALLRLAHEGLVDTAPRKGAVVADGKPSDLVDLFQFREALEGMAARLAAGRMHDNDKIRMRAAFEDHARAVRATDLTGHIDHDKVFHEIMIDSAGNRRITNELNRLRAQLQLFTRTMSAEPGAMAQPMIDAHEAILVAIEQGNTRAAEAAARAHVRGILAFYRTHTN